MLQKTRAVFRSCKFLIFFETNFDFFLVNFLINIGDLFKENQKIYQKKSKKFYQKKSKNLPPKKIKIFSKKIKKISKKIKKNFKKNQITGPPDSL